MAMGSAIGRSNLDVDRLGWTGQDLQRPGSVVAQPDAPLAIVNSVARWVATARPRSQ
jgi:hypothetical protein